MVSFVDKTVLVTGANSGYRRRHCSFARHGARIGLHFLETAPASIDGVRVGHGRPYSRRSHRVTSSRGRPPPSVCGATHCSAFV